MGRREKQDRIAAEEADLRRMVPVLAVVFASIFLLAVGIKVYGPVPADASKAFKAGATVGLAVFLLPLAARLARHRRGTSLETIIGLAISMCLGIGGTLVGNGLLDKGPGRNLRLRIIRKETAYIGGRRRRWIVVPSWRTPGGLDTIREGMVLPSPLLDSLSSGDEVLLTAMPGRFGYEWLSSATGAAK